MKASVILGTGLKCIFSKGRPMEISLDKLFLEQ